MTRFLTVNQVLRAHRRVIETSGGIHGVRDGGGLEAAVAQPRMTWDGTELYPSVAEKAAALAFSLVNYHPFLDGNKRIGHAAMETFLLLNGYEVDAHVDEQDRVVLALAAATLDRESFTGWVTAHVRVRS